MQKLKIILSFDHELSLGGARSYQKNLFEPTRALFDLVKDLNVPLSFFTDVCCALRFYDWDLHDFYKRYCKQLIEVLSLGHEVQLYLHSSTHRREHPIKHLSHSHFLTLQKPP